MSREIRFKAWDTDNNRFLWTGFTDFTGESHSDKPQSERIGNLILNSDFGGLGSRVIFIQWTGLKDKNRKPIYEGDILKIFSIDDGELIDIVDFHDGAFVLTNPNKLTWHICDYKSENLQVIGNIYENPELLKP